MCGCEDADDLDHLRQNLAFKLTADKLPGGAIGQASQPTLSGSEIARYVRRLVCHIEMHWPKTRTTLCGTGDFDMDGTEPEGPSPGKVNLVRRGHFDDGINP